jgi:hypothetical protein
MSLSCPALARQEVPPWPQGERSVRFDAAKVAPILKIHSTSMCKRKLAGDAQA